MIVGDQMEDVLYSYYPRPYNLVYKETAKQMPFHMHNETEIVLCETGALDVAAGSSIYKISGNNLIFLPSNCVHRITADVNTPQSRFILTISPTWLSGVLGRDNKLIINSLEPRVLQLSRDEFSSLKDAFSICIESVGLKKLSLLFEILDECETMLGKERLLSELPVSGIIRYINDNISDELRVSSIAKRFYYNPDYLCRVFKKHMNISITEYINLQRISAAREMLDSGADIKTVQAETGFNSYSHFSRTFKKYMDITPKQYKSKKYYFDTVN